MRSNCHGQTEVTELKRRNRAEIQMKPIMNGRVTGKSHFRMLHFQSPLVKDEKAIVIFTGRESGQLDLDLDN